MLKSLKHLVISDNIRTFAVEIKNSLGDNLKQLTIMARVKYMYKEDGKRYNISDYPNFDKSGSIKGMKKIYGKDCLLVQCGDYIYNVSSNPEIYYNAH